MSYHEHDSLLQNITSEELTEEERKLAWEEYKDEREGRINIDLDALRECVASPFLYLLKAVEGPVQHLLSKQ